MYIPFSSLQPLASFVNLHFTGGGIRVHFSHFFLFSLSPFFYYHHIIGIFSSCVTLPTFITKTPPASTQLTPRTRYS